MLGKQTVPQDGILLSNRNGFSPTANQPACRSQTRSAAARRPHELGLPTLPQSPQSRGRPPATRRRIAGKHKSRRVHAQPLARESCPSPAPRAPSCHDATSTAFRRGCSCLGRPRRAFRGIGGQVHERIGPECNRHAGRACRDSGAARTSTGAQSTPSARTVRHRRAHLARCPMSASLASFTRRQPRATPRPRAAGDRPRPISVAARSSHNPKRSSMSRIAARAPMNPAPPTSRPSASKAADRAPRPFAQPIRTPRVRRVRRVRLRRCAAHRPRVRAACPAARAATAPSGRGPRRSRRTPGTKRRRTRPRASLATAPAMLGRGIARAPAMSPAATTPACATTRSRSTDRLASSSSPRERSGSSRPTARSPGPDRAPSDQCASGPSVCARSPSPAAERTRADQTHAPRALPGAQQPRAPNPPRATADVNARPAHPREMRPSSGQTPPHPPLRTHPDGSANIAPHRATPLDSWALLSWPEVSSATTGDRSAAGVYALAARTYPP